MIWSNCFYKVIHLNFVTFFFHFRLKHAQSELKKKQSELKNTEKSYKKDKDVYDAVEKSKSKLEVCVQFTILLSHLQVKNKGIESFSEKFSF